MQRESLLLFALKSRNRAPDRVGPGSQSVKTGHVKRWIAPYASWFGVDMKEPLRKAKWRLAHGGLAEMAAGPKWRFG